MRRLIPTTLVSMLAIIALLTALISAHESPKLAYFSQPKAGSLSALRDFRGDITSTLRESSFLEQFGEYGEIDYQAPNRTKSMFEDVTIIGRRAFFTLNASGDEVTRWGELALTRSVDDVSGPEGVRGRLRELFDFKSITKKGAAFIAKEVVDAGSIFPGTAGQVLLIATIRVRGGLIVGVRVFGYGYLPWFKNESGGTVKAVTVRAALLSTTRYSKFGRIKPIVAPPKRETVKLVPCTTGSEITIASTRYC